MRHDEMLGLLPRLKYGMDNSPGLWLFLFELIFWAIVILLTIALVRYRPVLLERVENKIRAISLHTRFWLVAFPLGVILFRAALLPWMPVPVPTIHDEYSYLLGADTFAHGRLTNPPIPMWEHFESFHINVQPTYQSMYPPAQGLALAAGQKLTTVPWTGVLLTTALMCGAIYWMLLGWLPPSWAWLGGVLAWARFGIFSYWVNSYLGGSVAALAGALVLGALPRFRKNLKMQTALIFAAGLLILANSRPLEGFLFSLPLVIAFVVIAIKHVRNGSISWGSLAKTVFPAVALLALGAAGMLYYNWRGTGNPLLMPYEVNFQTYHISKPFLFQKPNPIPEYRHPSMRALYVFHELPDLLRIKYALGYLIREKSDDYYLFFIWPFALLIAPCVYAMWRSEMRVVLFSVLLLAAELLAQVWPSQPQYAAPAAGALFLLIMYSVRHFRSSQQTYAIWGARALAIVFAVWMINPIAEKLRDPFFMNPIGFGDDTVKSENYLMPTQIRREHIAAELEARGGKHIVIVHYPTFDVPWQEWVYNTADIDHQDVIWARDMGYLKNQELLDYYPDRKVWYVDHAFRLGFLMPYDDQMAPIKLAFEGAAEDMNSAQVINASAQVSSAKAKTTAAHRTENLTPHSW